MTSLPNFIFCGFHSNQFILYKSSFLCPTVRKGTFTEFVISFEHTRITSFYIALKYLRSGFSLLVIYPLINCTIILRFLYATRYLKFSRNIINCYLFNNSFNDWRYIKLIISSVALGDLYQIYIIVYFS